MKVIRFLFYWGWVILFILSTACNKNTAQHNPASASFAFSSVLNEERNIFLFDLDSDTIRSLFPNEGENFCPAFSPDGNQIAYCGKRGEKMYPFIAGSEGSNPRILTEQIEACTCSSDAPLSWSPDGEWIALPVLASDPNQYSFHIVILRSDGSEIIRLTTTPQRFGGLVWNSDSRSILVSGTFEGIANIYQIDITTKKSQPLIPHSVRGAPTDWSPDDRQLLYYADSGDGNFDIFLLKKGEDLPERLTTAASFDSYPQWFPDGKHILFVSQRDGNHEIYRMNIDGSEQVNLTNNPTEMDVWPSISTDGKYIIYLTSDNNKWDSWMMNTDGSGKRKMTDLLGIPSKITWIP